MGLESSGNIKRVPFSHGFPHSAAISTKVLREDRETILLNHYYFFTAKGPPREKTRESKTRGSQTGACTSQTLLTHPKIFHISLEKVQSSKSFSHFTLSGTGNKEYHSVYFKDEE